MQSRFGCASAETLFETAHTGNAIDNLTNENFIGEVHEQSVFKHPWNVVDGELQGSGIFNSPSHFHVKNEIPLIGDNGPSLALSHPQFSGSTLDDSSCCT